MYCNYWIQTGDQLGSCTMILSPTVIVLWWKPLSYHLWWEILYGRAMAISDIAPSFKRLDTCDGKCTYSIIAKNLLAVTSKQTKGIAALVPMISVWTTNGKLITGRMQNFALGWWLEQLSAIYLRICNFITWLISRIQIFHTKQFESSRSLCKTGCDKNVIKWLLQSSLFWWLIRLAVYLYPMAIHPIYELYIYQGFIFLQF